jgi:dihydroflavonol-4-reductase
MKAFVTGGTGFLGQRLIPKLLAHNYKVTALVRSQKDAEAMEAMGVQPTLGDITRRESMRAGMRASDVVFHIAGWYKIGARDKQLGEKINVDGTRNVLELAIELGIPRIIYTSSVAVFGDTHAQLVNENYCMPDPQFLTEYDRTKWLADYTVAQPLAEKGAPIITVLPGITYGPGDPSLVGNLMRRFYLGQLPVFPAPELKISIAHVEDVAEGHILAAEKGKPGERYILAGPALRMADLVKIWADVTGRPAPILNILPQYLKPFGPLVKALENWIPLPDLVNSETIAMLDTSYIASSDKARHELEWQTRPVREGMRETFDSLARMIRLTSQTPVYRRKTAGLFLGIALGLLLVWLVTRWQRS